MNNERFLAIDFGTKKIGLACSEIGIAMPCGIVPTIEAIERITRIITEKRITHLLLGISHHLNGDESPTRQAREARSFVQKLKKHIDPQLPIIEFDESCTTSEARLSLSHTGHRVRSTTLVDDIAACILLQSYLDREEVTSGKS